MASSGAPSEIVDLSPVSTSLSTVTDGDLNPYRPRHCQRCWRRIDNDIWGMVPLEGPEPGWDEVCSLCLLLYTATQLSRSDRLHFDELQELERRLHELIGWLRSLAEPE